MNGTRKLPQAGPAGLGQPTIMDRALAAQFGVSYVHLSAFAIDVDRVFMATSDEGDLPFAWEVLLCLAYLVGVVDSQDETGRSLLEESCTHVLSFAPGTAPLGSLLVFAVYAGARAGRLNAELLSVFVAWKAKGLKQLEAAAAAFLQAPTQTLQRMAEHCLSTPLSPPLSPPSVATLQAMVSGPWPPRDTNVVA